MNGSKLKELRNKAGLGQVELAKRVGITQGMISQIEVGCRNCSSDILEALTRELHCTVEDLEGESPVFIRLMRNCKGLLPAQLIALNEVALQFKKQENNS